MMATTNDGDPPEEGATPVRRGGALQRFTAHANLAVLTMTLLGIPGLVGIGAFVVSEFRSSEDSKVALAQIVNTPEKLGIRANTSPARESPHSTPKRVYIEGETVGIVCQIRSGGAWPGSTENPPLFAVTAWNKLPTGEWLNDRFTNLKRKLGSVPPPGVPRCPEEHLT